MSCEHVRSVLSGESPWVDVGAHLDGCPACQAFAHDLQAIDQLALRLPTPPPPPALVDATLQAMDAQIQRPRGPGWGRWAVTAGGLLAAALVLTVIIPSTAPPDTSQMVERGLGERVPDVALKVAVDHGGTLDRLSSEHRYAPGDTLYFRVQVDADAWVALVRVDAVGSAIVHEQRVSPGDADLLLDDGPLAWRIEPGESDAVFALLAASAPVSHSQVEAALSSAYDQHDPEQICRTLRPLGLRCAASTVKVSP